MRSPAPAGSASTPTPLHRQHQRRHGQASYTYAGDANHTGSSELHDLRRSTQAASTTVVTCPRPRSTPARPDPCTVAVTGAGGLSLGPDRSYTDNTNAGTASASYTYAGDANHTGSSGFETSPSTRRRPTTVVTCPASGLHRLRLEPCTGSGHRRRRPRRCRPDAHLRGQHERRHGHRRRQLSPATPTTPAAPAPRRSTSTKARPRPSRDLPGEPGLHRLGHRAVHRRGDRRRAQPDRRQRLPATATTSSSGRPRPTPATPATPTTPAARLRDVRHHQGGVDHVIMPGQPVYTGAADRAVHRSGDRRRWPRDVIAPVSYTDNIDAGTANADATPIPATPTTPAATTPRPSRSTRRRPRRSRPARPDPSEYTGLPQEPCSASVAGAGGLNESLHRGVHGQYERGRRDRLCLVRG